MNRLTFSIDIKAEKTTIWKVLWAEHSYREWAGIFFEGSFLICNNWDAGGKVHFLGPDQSGIYSSIVKHNPTKIIQFKHIGNVVEGKEQPIDNESKKWTGATEIYSLKEGNETNSLTVEIDVMDEHLEFMTNTFPKALEKIKKNCNQEDL